MHRDGKEAIACYPQDKAGPWGQVRAPGGWRRLGRRAALGKQEQSKGSGGSERNRVVVRGEAAPKARDCLEGWNMRM